MRKHVDSSTASVVFRNKASTLLITDNILDQLMKQNVQLVERVERFLRNDSGWVVDSIKKINIAVTRLVLKY